MKIMKIICSVCTEIFETDSRKDFMCQRCVGVAEEAWNRLRDASLVKTPKDVQRVDYDLSEIARLTRRGDFWASGYERAQEKICQLEKVVAAARTLTTNPHEFRVEDGNYVVEGAPFESLVNEVKEFLKNGRVQ